MESVEQGKSLAQYVSERRENIGLSQQGLSKRCNISLKMIEDIECGNELFLATSVRQKLAKGLKIEPSELKKYDKVKILAGEGADCVCPVCGSKLVTRLAQMYDLEDQLQLHPKAHCTKCAFQIR